MNPEKSEKLLFIFFIFVFSYKHTFYVSVLNSNRTTFKTAIKYSLLHSLIDDLNA